MAARAGATYVSPFLGRLDDIGYNGLDLISDIADIFAIHDIPSEIIAASIRHPMHVTEAAKKWSTYCDNSLQSFNAIVQTSINKRRN